MNTPPTSTDGALAHNQQHGRPPACAGSPKPRQKLAILTCMDTRLNPYTAMGLDAGDAHIIRNAGGILTDDAVRSLVLSSHELGTRELMIIQHTDCGLLNVTDEAVLQNLENRTGHTCVSPAAFFGFTDLDQNVRRQVRRARDHPWLQDLTVQGFIYEVAEGKLREVQTPALT